MAKYKITFPVFDGDDTETFYANDDQKAKEEAEDFLKSEPWDSNPGNCVWEQKYLLEKFDVSLGYYVKVGDYVITLHT